MPSSSFCNGPRTPRTLLKRRLLFAFSLPLLPVAPLSALSALLISTPAHAQTSNSADEERKQPGAGSAVSSLSPQALPAVSVSAQATSTAAPTFGGGQVAKTANLGVFGNQKIIDVPFSVTQYTEKAIKNKQAQTVGEFLEETDPNIRVAMNSGQFAENYVIRGFQLYSDDVALNGLYGLTPRQLVSTDAIGGVTLFKGAGAFLNGPPAGGTGVGGSVGVDLKRAGDAPLTELTTQVSGNGAVGAHIDVSRRFGDNDQFGVRFNQADQGGDTAIDHERTYNKTSALSLDWRGDKVRFTADFLYQNEKIDAGRSTFTATGAIPTAPSATSNYAQPWTYSQLEDTVGILGAEYDFAPGWTAYVKGGLRHTNEHGEYASPAYNGLTGVTASGYRLGTHFQENATSASTGVRGKFDTGPVSHQVNIGASIVSVQQLSGFTFGAGFASNLGDSPAVAYPATYYSGYAGGTASNPGKTEQQINKGISISDTLGFLHDRILFTVGARRQTIGVDAYSSADGSQTSTYSSSITTPIFGLVLKPLNTVSIYANRSEALVAGSSAPVTAVNYGQVFAPYKSKQWETGVKYDLGTFGANVALFQIEQPNAFTNASTLVYSQSGEQRNRGVELGIYGEPMRGLRLIAGASYTDAKLTKTDVAADAGNTAVGVPRYLANMGAEYDIPQLSGLTVTGQWVYTSRQFLDQANTLSIGSWSRFDLGARYTTQVYRHPVTLRATVQNVANRAYWASTYGGYLTLGSPRTLLLSLTTDF